MRITINLSILMNQHSEGIKASLRVISNCHRKNIFTVGINKETVCLLIISLRGHCLKRKRVMLLLLRIIRNGRLNKLIRYLKIKVNQLGDQVKKR